MYNVSASVIVKEIDPNKKIVIDWGNYQHMTTVEWKFESLGDKETYVSIVNSGFQGSQAEIISQVRDGIFIHEPIVSKFLFLQL